MFKNWLETNDTAGLWVKNQPKEPLKVIQSGVDDFVNAMADEEKNVAAVKVALARSIVHQSRVEDEYIAGYLLEINDPRVRKARGQVTNWDQIEPQFRFIMKDAKAGWLFIIHEPVVYLEEDKQMLNFIIQHELRHVQDWIDPNIKALPPGAEWDKSLYVKNLYEARAYSDMLARMMAKFNNDVDKVIKLLQAKHFGMKPEIFRIALAFLQHYKTKNENMANFLGSAAGAAASLFGGTEPNLISPSAIVKADESAIEQAASLVMKIINLMRFKNYVKMP